MFSPGEAFVEMEAKIFNRFCLWYDSLVDAYWEPKNGGSKRKLANEELHDFKFSPNSIQMVRSRSTKRAKNVACTVA
jgi:hypothetical protein